MWKSPAKLRSIIHRVGCRKQWGEGEGEKKRKKEGARDGGGIHSNSAWAVDVNKTWMNEGLKVKLHGALRWAGDRQEEERGQL